MAEEKLNTQDRKVSAYPPPLYLRYFLGYVEYTGETESGALTHMIKNFFDNMPAEEKRIMLTFGKEKRSKNSY
jgi:hypothetical protein